MLGPARDKGRASDYADAPLASERTEWLCGCGAGRDARARAPGAAE